MCMHMPSSGAEKSSRNTLWKILASIAMVLTGCIIGISCALSVPSSFVIEASLGVAILLFIILLTRQENITKILPNEIFARDADHAADSISTSWTSSISSNDANDDSAEENPKRSSKRTIPDGDALALGKEVVTHWILPHSEESPSTPVEIPIHVRVEKEKLRLSQKNEPTGVRATARSLHFEGKIWLLHVSISEHWKNEDRTDIIVLPTYVPTFFFSHAIFRYRRTKD